MENNKLNEPRPVYIQELGGYPGSDEINLVDLILILVRRKMLILAILILSILVGLLTIFLSTKPSIQTYTTSIKIGVQVVDNRLVPLESPETLLAKIQHTFIPLTLNELNQSVAVNASIPKNSELILLEISSVEADDTFPIKVLNTLTKKIELDHDRIYDTIKRNLDANLKQVNLEAYAAQITGLQKTYAVSEPVKTTQSGSRTSGKIILLIALFGGIFLGIFAAFFAELWGKVKDKMQEQNT